MRIKSTHPESQGEFVEIEAADFNPDTMEEYAPEEAGKTTMTADEIRAELDARGVEYLARASKAELIALLEASNSKKVE